MGICQSDVGRSLLAEFILETGATFFFTLMAGLTYGLGGGVFAAVAVGLSCIFLRQSEKAHMNPVVSIAVALCDIEFGWVNLILRILAQFLGGILGGLLAVDTFREMMLDFSTAASSDTKILIYEALFSAVLVVVFLRTRGTSVLGPVVYGFVYFVAILCSASLLVAGNVLLNPAVAVGLVIGSSSFDANTEAGSIWKMIVGPFIGALLGVVYFQMTNALDVAIEETDSEGGSTTEPKMMQATVYEKVPVPQHAQVEMGPRGNGY